MEKIADFGVRSESAKNAGDQLQLIIMDPSEASRSEDLGHRFREPTIHSDVGVPPVSMKFRSPYGVVIKRPQGSIGEVLVVIFDLKGRKADRVVLDPLMLKRLWSLR